MLPSLSSAGTVYAVHDDIQCIRKKCKTTVYVPHYQEEECFGLYEGSLRDIARAEGNLEVEGDVQLYTSQLEAVYDHSFVINPS